jgi:hypothetical protein
LRKALCPHHTSNRLTTPLGHWLFPVDEIWNWWYHSSSNSIYHRTAQQWQRWEYQNELHNRKFIITNDLLPALPPDSYRASISPSPHGGTIILRNFGIAEPSAPPPPAPATFYDQLRSAPVPSHWATSKCRVPDNALYVAQSIS